MAVSILIGVFLSLVFEYLKEIKMGNHSGKDSEKLISIYDFFKLNTKVITINLPNKVTAYYDNRNNNFEISDKTKPSFFKGDTEEVYIHEYFDDFVIDCLCKKSSILVNVPIEFGSFKRDTRYIIPKIYLPLPDRKSTHELVKGIPKNQLWVYVSEGVFSPYRLERVYGQKISIDLSVLRNHDANMTNLLLFLLGLISAKDSMNVLWSEMYSFLKINNGKHNRRDAIKLLDKLVKAGSITYYVSPRMQDRSLEYFNFRLTMKSKLYIQKRDDKFCDKNEQY